jgi:hypothetical protein
MCDCDHNNDYLEQRQVEGLTDILKTMQANTFWTALGAIASWAAIILALGILLL